MAVTAFALHNIQYRLAQYYLDKLRAIEAAYLHGFVHSTHALSRFDQEWSQIKQWGDWAVAHASKDETTAVLCMAFPQAGANVLILRQPPQERLIWLQAGLSAARQHHDPHAAMVLLYLLARAYSSLRSLANAQDAAQQALTLARRIGDKLYQSRILITLGNIHYTEDEYDQSHQANQQALTLATALDAKQEMGAALNGLGNVALSHSDDQRAYDYYLQYLDIAEGLGRPHNICQALRNLSLVSMYMGENRRAADYAHQCVALASATGNYHQLASAFEILGDLALIEDDFDPALDYYQRSLDVFCRMRRLADEIGTLNQIGSLYVRKGDFAAALRVLEPTLARAIEDNRRWDAMMSFAHLTELYRRMGDLAQARQKLGEGLQIVQTVQSSGIRALYLLNAALIERDSNQHEQAAIWIGLLENHPDELVAYYRTACDDLRRDLELRLGAERFAIAIAQGNTLDLEATIQHLAAELHPA